MKIKILIILLMILLPTALPAQTYGWMDLSDNLPDHSGSPGINSVFFVGEKGWLTTCTATVIFYTDNAGQSFEIQEMPTSINEVYMLDENRGFAAGSSGAVFYTENSGANWNLISLSFPSNVRGIDFPPGSEVGFICGDNGWVAKVCADSVYELADLAVAGMTAISCPESINQAWVCGGSIIRHYLNGEWLADQSATLGYWATLHMYDNSFGWAGGDGGMIIHTENGYNWVRQDNPDTLESVVSNIFSLDSLQAYAVSHIVLHTTDGGVTWVEEAQNIDYHHFLIDVFAVDEHNVYVVGQENTFMKYGELTGIEETTPLPSGISLHQNYPNPFNAKTSIRFDLDIQSQVTLDIYNVLGERVSTLADGIYPAGNHTISFDASPYASGVYFYKLDTGGYIETKTMLFIK